MQFKYIYFTKNDKINLTCEFVIYQVVIKKTKMFKCLKNLELHQRITIK